MLTDKFQHGMCTLCLRMVRVEKECRLCLRCLEKDLPDPEEGLMNIEEELAAAFEMSTGLK